MRAGLVNGEHRSREQYKVTAVLDRCADVIQVLQYCQVLPGLHEVLYFCQQRAPNRKKEWRTPVLLLPSAGG